MKFNPEQKLGVVKMIDSVIQADGEVHPGEVEELNFLMDRMDFDIRLVLKAQKNPQEKSISILKGMPEDKKTVLGEILVEMANADGFFHLKEMDLITKVCTAIGITVDTDV